MAIFHSYVGLPEGILFLAQLRLSETGKHRLGSTLIFARISMTDWLTRIPLGCLTVLVAWKKGTLNRDLLFAFIYLVTR